MSMDIRQQPAETSLRKRFRLLNPFEIANPWVRRFVLCVITAVITLVAMTSHQQAPNYARNLPGQLKLAPDQLPRDLLYSIPRGELEPTAPYEFSRRWGDVARSMVTYPNHPWAGKYVRPGTAGDDVLVVSPLGFAARLMTATKGKSEPHYLMGRIADAKSVLTMTADKNTPLEPLAEKLYAATWGGRHYLLNEDEVRQQAAALQATGKPNAEGLDKAFIRAGDQSEPVTGTLVLPATVAQQ